MFKGVPNMLDYTKISNFPEVFTNYTYERSFPDKMQLQCSIS